MRPTPLAFRLLLWIVPVVLVALFGTAASTYFIARRAVLIELEHGVQTLTVAAAAQVRSFFDQRANDLATIAQSPLFRDHYMNVEYGLEQEAETYRNEIDRMLQQFSRRTGVYPRLAYLDPKGRMLNYIRDGQAAPHGEGPSEEFAEAFAAVRNGQRYRSGMARVPWHPVPVVLYGSGIRDERGKLRGVLVFSVSLSPVYDTLTRLRIGHSGRSTIADRRGAPEAPPGASGLMTTGVPVPGTPWRVVTTVDRSEFLDRLQWIATATLLLGLIAGALLVLVIARTVRAMLGPINVLAEAANAYAEGDLDVRVKVADPREVAALADAFNMMADSLKQRTEDLEQRVRELTAFQRMNQAALLQLGRREIGRACLDALLRGLGFERGVFYWVEEGGDVIADCAAGGEPEDLAEVLLRRLPADSTEVVALAARGRETIQVDDVASDPRCSPAFRLEMRARSIALAPIVARDRVLGVIAAGHSRAGRLLSAQELRSLSLFCGAAGLALENAQLTEARLRSEERYRTAVENSPHAVVGLDQNLRIMLWNRRAEALFGYQPTEAYGRTLSFLFDPAGYRQLEREVEVSGAVRQMEISGQSRDGRRLELNVSWAGQAGSVPGAREWFVVLQDDTEKKRLQSRLIQAAKMSAVGNLIAGVAHELNNPLAAVAGFAELLKDLPGTPEQREDLRSLHTSALRCRDIVQGLLFFVRQERPRRERLSINELVQETISLCEYRLTRTEGLALDIALETGVPEVAADFQKLQQVLVNLLNNASDALKERRGRRMIRVRTVRAQGGSELVVEDNGPGVPADLREKVFESFYTTKPAGKGTGLGLAICRQIVFECGGALRCEEGPEGGARFVLWLPVCPPDVTLTHSPVHLPPPVKGCKALVVDDEPDLVHLMTRLLREDGVAAVSATGGREARERLAAERFDAVIADVDLGGFDGLELLREAPEARFVFVTGDVLNESVRERLTELDIPLLSKPFLRTDFLRIVRRILGARAAGRRL